MKLDEDRRNKSTVSLRKNLSLNYYGRVEDNFLIVVIDITRLRRNAFSVRYMLRNSARLGVYCQIY